jgi:Arylsulfotransferase (ASST)
VDGDSDRTDDGAPYLVHLGVTAQGATSPTIDLVPSFAPDVYDYYVRCVAGTNALRISLTASPGAESALVQPTKSAALPSQTLSLTVTENDALVATASREALTTQYWVRCLPRDFPTLQMTPHPAAGRPTPAYYLVGNATVLPGASGYAMVLDTNGVPVWYHQIPLGVFNVDDVPTGEISFIGAPVEAPYEVHELRPWTMTYVTTAGLPPDEHELQVLPNGNFLVFAQGVEKWDLSGYTVALPDGGVESFGPDENIVPCNIDEVDPSGTVVWEWIATDHFDPVKDQSYQAPILPGPGGTLLFDFFHCNSIDLDAAGNMLVSSRNMDSVFYVERPSGKVVWKMGGQSYTKDGATYVSVASPFRRQHDARFQPGWMTTCSGSSGQISLFDDETDESGPARAVVYDVGVAPTGTDGGTDGGTDAGCGTPRPDAGGSLATVAWQYQGTASVEITGSFRITADGSRVIGWGMNGGLVFSEVDVGGHDLLDFYFSDAGYSYRAIKVPESTFDLTVLRSTAGLP